MTSTLRLSRAMPSHHFRLVTPEAVGTSEASGTPDCYEVAYPDDKLVLRGWTLGQWAEIPIADQPPDAVELGTMMVLLAARL